ncbi:hypothetical protein H5P28_10610 [Ruficoccus amylovorans]|uniref:Uncharacterized protein n=1 Tax=Ruficoccus amylovorans TaxID=1804625 RepID=A0A842HE51_9BACT|nr:hypothetical protein [Ruficoccus amylovorans]MBC2594712.1 hypothetical protein [Ruficoccus amylovorans]
MGKGSHRRLANKSQEMLDKQSEVVFPPDYDWKFGSVPENELEACLLWEHGRESDILRQYCATNHSDEKSKFPIDVRRRLTAFRYMPEFYKQGLSWQDLDTKAKANFLSYAAPTKGSFTATTPVMVSAIAQSALRMVKEANNPADMMLLLITPEVWESCSDSTLTKEFQALLKAHRPKRYPGKKAHPIPALSGSGISKQKRRAFLVQLGALRLGKKNSTDILVKAYSAGELDELVIEGCGSESYSESSAWSKAKKNVEERISKLFPFTIVDNSLVLSE